MSSEQLRRLSPKTLELFERLWNKPTIIGRWFRSEGAGEVIREIGESREPAAIRDLMPFGLARDKTIRKPAREAIEKLFALLPVQLLPMLDQLLRQSWRSEDWNGLRPEAVSDLELETSSDRIFVGFVASHRSGFVRAEAVKLLAQDSSPSSLPFILLRLCDWVYDVRILAEQAFQGFLSPQFSDAFVASLPLLERLRVASRFSRVSAQQIEDFLRFYCEVWFGIARNSGIFAKGPSIGASNQNKTASFCFESKLRNKTAFESSQPEDMKQEWGPGFILERPKVFRLSKHRFVMYVHLDAGPTDKPYRAAEVGVAISNRVEGPYKLVKHFRPLGQESRDIGQFVDDDGANYLMRVY